MLTQAVQSGDRKLLERVLQVKKDQLISGTVKKLPVTTIVPFLKIVSLSKSRCNTVKAGC